MAEKTPHHHSPACTGPLHYDGASGKLVCDYCGSAYDVKDIEARYAKKQAAADTAAEGDAKKAARLPRQDSPVWSEAEAEGLNSYSCPTCGAELVCDETTAATTCPYCGKPTVLGGQLSGEHGIGNGRLEFLEEFAGPRMIALYKAIKLAFDDKLILNPGKVIEYNK